MSPTLFTGAQDRGLREFLGMMEGGESFGEFNIRASARILRFFQIVSRVPYSIVEEAEQGH